MSKLFTLISATILGSATWFLLFVILGTGLGTAFIAGGVVLAAGVIATAMIAGCERGFVLDTPLTTTGLLAGVAAFVVLEVVLSVPMWIGVITGLSVIGLYDISRAILFPVRPRLHEEPVVYERPHTPTAATNGNDQYRREPVAAR